MDVNNVMLWQKGRVGNSNEIRGGGFKGTEVRHNEKERNFAVID